MDDAIWVTERAILKAELEWKKAIPLMEELKLKPQLQNFRAWLWASSTVSTLQKKKNVVYQSINAG